MTRHMVKQWIDERSTNGRASKVHLLSVVTFAGVEDVFRQHKGDDASYARERSGLEQHLARSIYRC